MLVNNAKSNIISTHGKMLKPGVNKVDPKWWAKVREHPQIRIKLEKGTLEEVTEFEEAQAHEALGDDGADEMAIDHITTLSLNAAKALIKDTIDLDLLKAWKAKDKRKGVKEACDAQIEKVTAAPEIRDRTQSRQIVTGKGPEVVEVEAKPSAQDD